MDSSGIVFVVLFSIIMLVVLGLALKYKEQVGKYVVDNKAFSIILLVVAITYSTYQWYLHREQKKKKDLYQTKKATNTCPDYWQNVSKSKDVLECKNVHNLGKYNYGNNTKTFDGIYQDAEKGDLRKCHYAKIAKISWEGIDNLCPDVD